MRQVQLNDDGQLAILVGEVEAGESVTILRGKLPVAQIIPFTEANDPIRVERMAALGHLTAIMDKGYDMGQISNGRDELYERDVASVRREAAIKRLDEIMEEGISLGGVPPTRDEMHDGR